jgi:hypothetical protein
VEYQLAQLNIARLRAPLDHEDSAEFVRALDPINLLAEVSPGFVWRLKDDDGASSSYVEVEGIDDELTIVNMSVWEDLESLRHYVFRSGHTMYLRRRRDWFEKPDGPTSVCWWIPKGTIPDVDEAYRRLLGLRANGPSDEGWPLTSPLPPPSA